MVRDMSSIKVGISQCLLGANVRFDGGKKNDRFCQDDLSKLFEFTPLCPEVGIGLPIPRKAIRLIGDPANPSAVASNDASEDYTQPLKDFAHQNQHKLEQMSGYVFCKASPSCGLERVKVYGKNGGSEKTGMGIFAAKVKALFPNLPTEEDGRLNDPLLRDSFIKRVYIYHEWKQIQQQGLTRKALYKFHARHKFTLLAHCQKTYRKLGPLVAGVNPKNLNIIADEYIQLMMLALQKSSTRSNNTNVLMHMQGYLKEFLPKKDKVELAECILEYRKGMLPILSPLTLMKHHFNHFPNDYIKQQSYLNPYPKQLAIQVAML
jgi:uncharacterized protein YbgA (DUF1722 family)/uncharacterized protein YbbK (DUF523 family)